MPSVASSCSRWRTKSMAAFPAPNGPTHRSATAALHSLPGAQISRRAVIKSRIVQSPPTTSLELVGWEDGAGRRMLVGGLCSLSSQGLERRSLETKGAVWHEGRRDAHMWHADVEHTRGMQMWSTRAWCMERPWVNNSLSGYAYALYNVQAYSRASFKCSTQFL